MRCSETAPAGEKEALPMAGAKRSPKKPVGRGPCFVQHTFLCGAHGAFGSVPATVPAGAQRLRDRASIPSSCTATGSSRKPSRWTHTKCCSAFPQELLRAYGVDDFCDYSGTVTERINCAHQHGLRTCCPLQPRFQVPLPGVVFFLLHLHFGGGLVPWYILIRNTCIFATASSR